MAGTTDFVAARIGKGMRMLMQPRGSGRAPRDRPRLPRAFSCQCGRPVFFSNSVCLACGTLLGYDAVRRQLLPLEPDGTGGWRPIDGPDVRYRLCDQREQVAGCNWVLEYDEPASGERWQCRCCRLLRTRPDLNVEGHAPLFHRIEQARRRLVSALVGLRLPVASKVFDDPQAGLAFDVLRAAPGEPPVVTGHADGVITLDLEEADDVRREQRRTALREPYRTLLGHLRHESGHYYWQRLVEPDATRLADWRTLFGDERDDYAAALARHHDQGPPADWQARHVSAYASAHPWEDWAETWAHYLHMVDALDTARSFGIDASAVTLDFAPFDRALLPADAQAGPFLERVRAWLELAGVLNELSRSIGVHDYYPFVLSDDAVRKLFFVHRMVIGPHPAPEPSP